MYYPKSQITSNLYSDGNLAFKTTRDPYYGYYYSTSDGKYFVGSTPNGDYTSELILIVKDINTNGVNEDSNDDIIDLRFGTTTNSNYSYLISKTPETPLPQPPKPYISSPTESERKIGEYRRYFAKKGNELLYIEINKDTYNQFNSRDPKTLSNLYEVIDFPFSLLSTETNINLAAIIERKDKWFGFSQFIQNLS